MRRSVISQLFFFAKISPYLCLHNFVRDKGCTAYCFCIKGINVTQFCSYSLIFEIDQNPETNF